MISLRTQLNLQHAKKYFREHLAVGDYCAVQTADYYAEKDRLAGEWFGEGAVRLNLREIVGESAFFAVRDSKEPDPDKRLPLRRNSVRRSDGKRATNCRVQFALKMNPPKSILVVALMHEFRVSLTLDLAIR